jgi:hypothetical protein
LVKVGETYGAISSLVDEASSEPRPAPRSLEGWRFRGP